MKQPTDMGLNRSGLATAPVMAPSMLEVPALTHPTHEGEEGLFAEERISYSQEGEPAVTMPPPASMKELATSTVKLLKGEKATVLIDKLGERLAFERSGVRLYEALISKFDAFGTFEGGPSREDLVHILNEEREHFQLLAQTIRSLGSDFTAVTPSANVHDVMSEGLRAVMTDPRTNLQQGLEAALLAELADNDCWTNLIRLATQLGGEDLAKKFTRCLENEEEHLSKVRSWISASIEDQAGTAP